MKSSNERLFSINLKLPLRCTDGLLLCLRSLLQGVQYKKRAEKTSRSEKRIYEDSNSVNSSKSVMTSVLAGLEDVVTECRTRVQAIRNSKEVARAFPRVFIGFFLLVIVAPYADVFYTRLDFNARVSPDVWYYESYHWLFLCLGPYLKTVFQTIALYLIFNVKGNMILAPVAAYSLMYDIGKIFWLLQVSNHEEYKSLPTTWYMVYGFLAGLFLLVMLDRLTFYFNHRWEAIRRRLHGLRNIADKADAQIIVSGFVRTMDDDVLVQEFRK